MSFEVKEIVCHDDVFTNNVVNYLLFCNGGECFSVAYFVSKNVSV